MEVLALILIIIVVLVVFVLGMVNLYIKDMSISSDAEELRELNDYRETIRDWGNGKINKLDLFVFADLSRCNICGSVELSERIAIIDGKAQCVVCQMKNKK